MNNTIAVKWAKRNLSWLIVGGWMSFVFLTLLMLPVLGTATDTPTPRRSFLVQRDVVAMHIMSGMAVNNVGRGTNAFDQRLAKRAYQMADALIREGNRQ